MRREAHAPHPSGAGQNAVMGSEERNGGAGREPAAERASGGGARPEGAGAAGTAGTPSPDLAERTALAAEVCAALEAAVAGSRATLIGSLARGAADAYSDVDVAWVVPDAEFGAAVAPERVRAVLGRLRPVEDLRIDPDHRHSDRRRLLFARFAGLPLFWRLDLSVRAASVAHDTTYDDDNPDARARADEWSRPASALANATGAVKAVARHRPDDARGLLDRGFARIGEPDRATGAWPADIARLARAAARQDPTLTDLAEQVVRLAAAELAPPGEAG